MIGLLLLMVILGAGWFAWLYWVSPASDQDRIRADQAGTDAQVINIERVGIEHDRPELTWVAGHAAPRSGATWYRIYMVTVARPGSLT